MQWRKKGFVLMLAVCAIALFIGWHYFSGAQSNAIGGTAKEAASGQEWNVSENGILQYQVTAPQYNVSPPRMDGNSTVSLVSFYSRMAPMSALLRIPRNQTDACRNSDCNGSLPGVVLLPGATVSKEAEQGLARRLSDLGYASITLDQRNLGGIDPDSDLQMFLKGVEPTEHKMVYDAMAEAEILRKQPEIDPDRIIYIGESNGGRFAIIACALDALSKGVIAISTCGYGTGFAIASAGGIIDRDTARFYRSIDPESYLNMISPRPLVMIHSLNDTIISYQLAEQTYRLGLQPKRLHTVGCRTHGFCPEMGDALKEELDSMR
jgi:fermentation-respiration switch protein FrsA (DUF1100 family)